MTRCRVADVNIFLISFFKFTCYFCQTQHRLQPSLLISLCYLLLVLTVPIILLRWFLIFFDFFKLLTHYVGHNVHPFSIPASIRAVLGQSLDEWPGSRMTRKELSQDSTPRLLLIGQYSSPSQSQPQTNKKRVGSFSCSDNRNSCCSLRYSNSCIKGDVSI